VLLIITRIVVALSLEEERGKKRLLATSFGHQALCVHRICLLLVVSS